MKKVVEFFKWPISYLFSAFCLPYIYWLLFIPMEISGNGVFEAFVFGIFLLNTLLLFIILFRLASSSLWGIFTVPLVFISIFINIIYLIWHFPIIKDHAVYNGEKYYLVWHSQGVELRANTTLYRCQQWSLRCQSVYSSNQGTNIIIDKEKDEISLIRYDSLIYTHGPSPRNYQSYTLLLEDELYAIAWVYKKNSYVLFNCNTDYKSCDPLPIEYKSYFDNSYLELEINEQTKEINLLDTSSDIATLIFTYGENPRCYVDKCEILKP